MAKYTDLDFFRKQIKFELELLIEISKAETINEKRYKESFNDFCKKWNISHDTVKTWITNNGGKIRV